MKIIIQEKFAGQFNLSSHFITTNPYAFLEQFDFYYDQKFEMFKHKVLNSYVGQIFNFNEPWIETSEVLFTPFLPLVIGITSYILFISALRKNLNVLSFFNLIIGITILICNSRIAVSLTSLMYQDLLFSPFIIKIALIVLSLSLLYSFSLYNYSSIIRREYLDIFYVVLFFILSLFVIFTAQNLILIYLAIEFRLLQSILLLAFLEIPCLQRKQH